MRTTISFFALVVLLQALPATQAGEKRITGKIVAIDVDDHSITVEALKVDVIRKTKVTIAGKPSKLEDLVLGSLANVTYDDKLDAATAIAVTEPVAEDAEKTAADMKFLQGNWVGIAEEEINKEILDKEAVKERDRRVTISRNNFTMRSTLYNKRRTYSGKFDINAATGEFDFIGKGSNGELVEWAGTYEIKDDTWRLCSNFKPPKQTGRPEKVGPDENEKSGLRLFILKRDVE